mmetsp:Transcript_12883/g.11677  ORF Transcript_12883/g.11677 Transcript_12883/m.11677 type:complete len:353 (-) Transcript_12883:27-1085(-)
MTSKYVQKLMDLSLKEMGERTFTKALNTHTAKLISLDDDNEGFTYSYTIPKILCKSIDIGGKTIDILPPSSALAIMDDLSAYAVIYKDKSHRPGVSVKLTTEILRPCYPDTEVLCRFKVDKVGKSMGFCYMEILEKDSKKLIARGQHIKYMPMGITWELLFSPKVTIPLMKFYENNKESLESSYLGRFILNSLVKISGRRNVPNILLDNDTGAIFRALQIEKENLNINNNSFLSSYLLNSRYGINMIVGQIHGGATAIAIEQAVSETLQSKSIIKENLFMQYMEVTYLSALKGKLRIVCKDDAINNDINTTSINPYKHRIIGEISSSNNAIDKHLQPSAKFSCFWVDANKLI